MVSFLGELRSSGPSFACNKQGYRVRDFHLCGGAGESCLAWLLINCISPRPLLQSAHSYARITYSRGERNPSHKRCVSYVHTHQNNTERWQPYALPMTIPAKSARTMTTARARRIPAPTSTLRNDAPHSNPKNARHQERRCEGFCCSGGVLHVADRLLSTRKLILRTASARTPWTARPAAPLVAAGLPRVRPDAPGARAPNLGAAGHAPLAGCSLP